MSDADGGPFAIAHEKRLGALNFVKHQLTGEDSSIVLLCRNFSTGANDSEVATIDDNWQKSRIRRDFNGNDGDNQATFVEVFEVAETGLSFEDGLLVTAVKHGSKLYRVLINAEPTELQRYWRFSIIETEQLPE